MSAERMDVRVLDSLPEGYLPILKVDFKRDKKLLWKIENKVFWGSIMLAVIMHFVVPITTFVTLDYGFLNFLGRLAAALAACFAYMLLHELAHGVAMRCMGGKKVSYGFSIPYAYAGSGDFFGRKSYTVVALAPVLLFAVLLTVIMLLVPRQWFWAVWLVQIFNLTGSVGDYYVTWRFAKLPADILVQDSGVSMTVYSKEKI